MRARGRRVPDGVFRPAALSDGSAAIRQISPVADAEAVVQSVSMIGNDSRLLVVLAGIAGATAVAAGAYGAHALKAPEAVLADAFRTGVLYHLVHAPALLGAAWLCQRAHAAGATPWPARAAGAMFAAGIVLFSGTLYLFGISGRIFVPGGAPTGGILLMLGWATTAIAAFPPRRSRRN